MAPITVRALKAFAYRDRIYNPGDSVTFTNPVEASVRARRGEVSLDRHYNSRVIEAESQPEPEPEPELEQPVRRRYRRRDMTPEKA